MKATIITGPNLTTPWGEVRFLLLPGIGLYPNLDDMLRILRENDVVAERLLHLLDQQR